MPAQRALIYARLSVSREESVSIARQVERCRDLAKARGWEVVDVITDDGVSATKNKPEDRPGWQKVLSYPEPFEHVIVWKIDRLARSTMDFLSAHETLKKLGAALVAVEDPIDMGTDQGEMFATILAAFAQMEARTIASRVRDARRHLIDQGRVVGGRLPYGWTSEKREDGGRYLVQDPERIGYVRTAAQMILDGKTVKAVCTWLDTEGAPLPPSKNRKGGGWHFSTVSGLLRNPVLWGGTLLNPGNASKERGPEVKRDENGMPVINPEVAIMSPSEHRKLVALLDERERPRTEGSDTSPLFSRLVECGHCDRLMHRNRKSGRESLVCPECSQTVATRQLRTLVEQRLLSERGRTMTVTYAEQMTDNSAELGDIEEALREVSRKLTDDNADTVALMDQLTYLKELRAKTREQSTSMAFTWTGKTVEAEWTNAADDLERREVLAGQVESLKIVRGGTGRNLDPNRVQIHWREVA